MKVQLPSTSTGKYTYLEFVVLYVVRETLTYLHTEMTVITQLVQWL